MTTTIDAIRRDIVAFDFRRLFIEDLGWDNAKEELAVQMSGQDVALRAVAQKKGHVVYVCEAATLPAYPQRVAIERELTKVRAQHLIIFVDGQQQIWQHAQRVLGEQHAIRVRYFDHPYFKGQDGGALARRVAELAIDLLEEPNLTGLGVEEKKQAALTVERVTKKFYNEFEAQHRVFTGQIVGVDDEELRKWYASLMLNRLMFAYFIQRKGFLGGNDTHYLRHKLEACMAAGEGGAFFRYYKTFLLKFFHEGLGRKKEERAQKLSQAEIAMLGDVPYLNGGLFEPHQIERDHVATLDIPNEAFVGVFALFDRYDWTLDTRQKANDREINPDILGYIFEKFVNRKQMGAYYTKEDITDYISKNTIIPFLFDAAQPEDRIAFAPTGNVWRLLREEPDRYLYDAVRQGVIDEQGAIIPLPEEIAAGITTVSARGGWNRPATAPFALPTETWREHVARRQRCLEVREKLATGAVTTINDLITYNLNIAQFARDVIQQSDGPDLVNALYKSIARITVLDPTCGSGAFLFAALNLLAPLYEACLDRMQTFVEEDDARQQRTPGARQRHPEMRQVLKLAEAHLSRDYFILKSCIIQNLYGVDIMHEAVEIAKLRLFLKLVAQVRDAAHLEPLPDIDFNIRAGNTLVGYATYAEVERAVKSRLDFDNTMARIDEKAEQFARALDRFREQQTAPDETKGGKITSEHKQDLRDRLAALSAELDRYLAMEYGVEPTNAHDFTAWVQSHQPFHWYAEFYAIMKAGGFDVIIGNPPYVEYDAKLKAQYKINKYITLACGNLYPFVTERALHLAYKASCLGLIVPMPSINTSRMETLQAMIKPNLVESGRSLFISAYDERPSSLFDGVDQRLVIEIFGSHTTSPTLATTGINRWAAKVREGLLERLVYNVQDSKTLTLTPSILKIQKVSLESRMLNCFYSNTPIVFYKSIIASQDILAYRTAGGRYWKVFLDQPFDSESLSNKVSYLTGITSKQGVALASSSTFWWYYSVHFDMYNLKDYMIFNFRFGNARKQTLDELQHLGSKLVDSLYINSTVETVQSKTRGIVTSRQYVVSRSKPIIDEIDRVLAKHYGFTEEELDFILNYDIKYRMGKDAEETEEAEG